MASSEQESFSDDSSQTLGGIDRFCERGILWLVLFVLFYGPLAVGAVRTYQFAVIQGVTAAVLVLWGVRFWANRRFRLFWPPICWGVTAFLLYAIVRCQLADVEYVARLELDKVIVYAALFFAIVNNVNRRESTTTVGIALIGLAVVLCLFAFFQFTAHYPRIWGALKPAAYLNRGTGTYANPNHFAGFLEMILPLALAYTLMGRFKHVTKVLLGYAVLILLAGLGVSLSRGAMISAAMAMLALFVVLLFRREYRLQSAAMLAVMVVVAVLFIQKAEQSKHRFSLITISGKVDNDRFRYWEMAHQLYKTNPVWGIGPAHYDLEFWRYHSNDLLERPKYVHNDYLQALCEWGLVGVSLIGIICLLLGIGVVTTWPFVRRDSNELGSKSKNSTKAAFLLGGSFGLLALAFHSGVDFNMHIPANAIIAVALTALVSAQLRFATERYWLNPGVAGRVMLSIAVVSGVVFLTAETWRKGREGIALMRAETEKPNSPENLAALKQAAEIEPKNFETAYAIGEYLRAQSWQGAPGYKEQATEAMTWFSRAMSANPYDPFSPMRYGMCLDWLDRSKEATPYFKRACELEPKGTLVAAYEGWHYIQLEEYSAAKTSLERSIGLYYNDLAAGYLRVVKEQLARKEAILGK